MGYLQRKYSKKCCINFFALKESITVKLAGVGNTANSLRCTQWRTYTFQNRDSKILNRLENRLTRAIPQILTNRVESVKSSHFLIVVIQYSYHSLAKREICGNFSRSIFSQRRVAHCVRRRKNSILMHADWSRDCTGQG